MVRPLVLLRGLAREQGHWGDFPAQLEQTLQRPVLLQDLPGMGDYHQLESPASLSGLADWLLPVLRRRHAGPWHLLAMSLGAMLALELAVRARSEVASLALLNTSAGQLTPFYQRLRWQQYPAVLAAMLAPLRLREQLILQMTSQRADVRTRQLPLAVQIARQRPVQRRNVLRQLWAASQFRPAQKPQCPLLLLCGADDKLVDPACSAALAACWQLPLAVAPAAGHDLVLDAPDWLLAKLQAFYQPLP